MILGATIVLITLIFGFLTGMIITAFTLKNNDGSRINEDNNNIG